LWEGLERFAVAPHAVQHDGQLAGYGDHGSLLASLAPAGGEFEAPAAQRRVRAEAAEDVLGRLD